MIDYFAKRPMLFCGVVCCVISVLGYYFRPLLLIFGIAAVIFIAVMLIKQIKPAFIFSFTIILVMILSSIITYGKADNISDFEDKTYRAEFTVCDITYESSEYVRANIELKSDINSLNGAKVSVFSGFDTLQMGKVYVADIKFKEIDEKYKLNNYSQGVYINGSLSDITKVEKKYDFVLTAIGKTRDYIRTTLFSNLDYQEAATLCALLFGDRSYFTDDFYENVKTAGVSHVMVVSGMHLSVIVSILTKFMEKFLYNRRLKALLMVTVVLLLTALCGFTMSMLRAGVMYVLVALGLLLGRKSVAENTLGAATAIILIFSPFAVFNVAFQLSLLSTFGIVAVALPITDYISRNEIIKRKSILFVVSSVTVTLSAMIFTLPVCIYVFGYVSYIAPLANLLISSFVTYILCLALVALFFGFFWSFGAEWIFVPCEGLLKYINFIINKLGSHKVAVVSLPRISVIFSVFLIMIIFWVLLACKKRRNMVKLKEIQNKIIKEGGRNLKWQ